MNKITKSKLNEVVRYCRKYRNTRGFSIYRAAEKCGIDPNILSFRNLAYIWSYMEMEDE